ncbi:MAG: Unknown protein [uncultured Aureispira sp.]|uniref:Uncharacterized protein n=1 Tax=uncultured Aureispira sp. TaxID=1331704 RepID=A0A6S6U6T3_9BACT|nr:MAG: Unknown protein [uncultured Aureispira sp.]
MRRLYSGILAIVFGTLCSMPAEMIAQKGPSEGTSGNVRTKIVRDCEYEVLPGLAEVTSIEKVRKASESALKYDEHEVLFRFTAMEGGEVLDMLRDTDIEFVLRSRAIRVPVGPEYIKAKNLKVGTKYAMNLLQTKNRDACLELYTYESKALDNDLFEAYEHIIDYTKEAYVQQLAAKERSHARSKANEEDVVVEETVDPTIESEPELTDTETAFDYGGLTPEEISNLTEEEMRTLVEQNLRKKYEDGGTPTAYAGVSGIDEAEMRAEIEAEQRERYASELTAAENGTLGSGTTTSYNATAKANNSASDAIREAKRKAKEAEKEMKLEEKRQEQEEVDRARQKYELREKLKREVEAEIRKEIEEKAEAARQVAAQEAKQKQEELNKKAAAIEKIKEIEREMSQRIVDETKRKDCVFGERISGTIEVLKVSKVKEANLSHLKYTEYEVTVTFRPDNYADLSKKEKKDWESTFVFTLDPMGVNANPGAGYIRKYKVFKASKYQGFSQALESGICNEMMLYSPDLPNDGAKIKLK